MRWYVVVEGKRTEARIYPSWLAHAFPQLERVQRIEDMADDRYYLIAGYGYPSYFDRIHHAIEDIEATKATSSFDHLVICVDAEEETAAARRAGRGKEVSSRAYRGSARLLYRNLATRP